MIPISSWLIIITVFLSKSLFLVSCLEDTTSRNQLKGFVSCLTDHNINNFTTYSDGNYNDVIYSSLYNLRFSEPSVPKPEAIIAPFTKEQLVNTVLCCKKESLEIRIRCGGHSTEGTSSFATDGSPFVIIEMLNLDKISVDEKEGFVWIEGGATLGQSYLAIAQVTNDYTIPAGTWPTVGVGGHISGGGIGPLSRKYGLAADHVLDALLINAKGQVLDRQAMGEDVFWAIRGGGGGVWGIVFAWKISLVAIPRVMTTFTAIRSHPKYDVAGLLHKWQFVTPKLEKELSIVTYIKSKPSDVGNDITITFRGTYQGPIRNVVSTLESVFPELGISAEDCREMSWLDVVVDSTRLLDKNFSDLSSRILGNRAYFKLKYDYVRTPIPIIGIRAVFDMLEKQPNCIIYLEPLGGFMDEVASNSIPFPHRKGNIYGLQYEVQWQKEDNGKSGEYLKWIRELQNALTPYVSNSPRASYVNIMDLDLGTMDGNTSDEVEMARVWGEKYFMQNYNRLVRAKTLIDPNNIFRNQQSIPPMPSIRNRSPMVNNEMK